MMVSSVSKQEQPVATGQRTAAGCLCQEKGQWEQRVDAATGRHMGPRGRFCALVQTLSTDLKGSWGTKARAEEP